jgi:probable HAF family extracellular repeat protein
MIRIFLASTGFLLLGASSASAEALFQGLGDLAGGPFESRAAAVSGDGETVVGRSRTANGLQAFRYTLADGLQSLGPNVDGLLESEASAVSYDGAVIVGGASNPGTTRRAYRWTPGSGVHSLGDIIVLNPVDPEPVPLERASTITRDGTRIYGTFESPSGFTAGYEWTAGGVAQFPISNPSAVSDDGRYVAGNWGDSFYVARWDFQDDVLRLLGGSFPDTWLVYDMTADASVIIGIGSGSNTPNWIWEGGVLTPLSYDARAITPDGVTIAGCTSTHGPALVNRGSGVTRGLAEILLTDYGVEDAFAGWTNACATDISDDGRVTVGNGTNPDGHPEAWIVVLPPPSGGCGMLGIEAILLGVGVRSLVRRGQQTKRSSARGGQ